MSQNEPLTAKQEALAGVAASIASGCRPCTRIWMQAARKQGACERSIRLAIDSGLAVREAATREMADFAEAQQGAVPDVDDAFRAERTSLIEVFSCAAATAAQTALGLERHIDSARGYGATTEQISVAVAIGRAIRKEAGKQVEKVVNRCELTAAPSLAGEWCCETLKSDAAEPPKGCCCDGGRS
jgi:alkylhydroperoxidase/carboxymuconolactone decarboxylase family protein YurZ